jgi:PKD repeat protein
MHFAFLRILLFLSIVSTTSLSLWAQCPGCAVDLPTLPEDTIFIGNAPNGVVGMYYDEDISFRVPKTTTPVAAVDSTILPGLPITSITITAVTNLPLGLSWEASQLEFQVDEETDGCVKFCGIPVFSDSFFVQVQLEAQVIGITQSASFALPIYIEPASSVNDGFAMANNVGCGSTTVSFTNNVPSNGNAGFSYSWDFGNGNTSTQENPPPQIYSSPGIYPVTYEATVDTTGYFLTNVTVEDTDCNDFAIPPGNKPDLYFEVQSPGGVTIYTSSTQNNADLPASFDLTLTLGTGNYTLTVYDDDLFGDEECGSVNFTQTTTGLLIDGSLEVTLDIVHPVTVIQTTDTVQVFPQPEVPLIDPLNAQLCAGDSLALFTDYTENLQWDQDSLLLPGDTLNPLIIQEEGTYWVTYANEFGCTATSLPSTIEIIPLPFQPVYVNENNLLYLFFPDSLPDNYSLQWFTEGIPIAGANGLEFCISEAGTANYSVLVTDLDTGCSNSYSTEETYDQEVDCYNATVSTLEDSDITLFPNPVVDQVSVKSGAQWQAGVTKFRCFNQLGQMIWQTERFHAGGPLEQTFDLGHLPSGSYWMRWEHAGTTGTALFKKR